MKKKIEDYLHLYLGCQMLLPNGSIELLDGVMFGSYRVCETFSSPAKHTYLDFAYSTAKPILRPLSDITDEEAIELCEIEGLVRAEITNRNEARLKLTDDSYTFLILFKLNGGNIALYKNAEPYPMAATFKLTRYLLKQRFDLFGLIEENLAVNKLSLVQTKTI